MRRHVVLLGFTSLFLSACASVDVRPVTSPNQAGIRYWRPEVLLALQETKDKEGRVSCDVKTFTLPDKSEEYAITTNAGMGTAKSTPTLYEGWRLDGLQSDIDSKAADNITAVASLLKALPLSPTVSSSGNTKTAPSSKCEGVFRIEYDSAGQVLRFRRIEII
ncbi:hypothetical protein [Ancylobacter sp. SL191]|uniref:hypothetical protein n=1 Tax=Ancylobacter sp. SL191 TaxID=2995166 RepID=UPI00226DB11E|nr:hypothetical protein [Ancylobacter sp. SL191]WAC27881.1 hypothetical protein OU996_02030 [Ancylobacter sp. SL191]